MEPDGGGIWGREMRAGVDRGAGGEEAGSDRGGMGTGVVELWRVEPACEPCGAPVEGGRVRAGGSSRGMCGPRLGTDGGAVGGAEGGRGVCAAGCGVSGGTAELDGRGQQTGGAADRSSGEREAGGGEGKCSGVGSGNCDERGK